MKYPNFYENLKEAQARLLRTVVLYDSLPYYVLAITNHKPDDIFRVWLEPVQGLDEPKDVEAFSKILCNYNPDYHPLGGMLDDVLDARPDCGVLRKHMNSPKFKSFRPFPLGMCNMGKQTFYLERRPVRPSMHQGLAQGGVFETLVTTGSRNEAPRKEVERVNLRSLGFRDCILADHYAPDVVLMSLQNPNIDNDAHAIHREFALVRGPMDMIFLAYRTDVIGVLSQGDFSELRLGRDYRYCREAVEELNLFNRIV